ncbi:MAG: hypothetical protein SFV22_20525 [Saprospiraceae bacterium]|nr:hypothetical protein [Saprospiraceae bacterium]
MKKAIFLFAALLVAAFAIYSCQKDSAEQAVQTATGQVADRNPYDTCDDCFNECNDCCIRFQRHSGAVTLVYKDATTGNIKTLPMTSVTSQDTVVCALGGYFAVHAGAGNATVSACGTSFSPINVVNQIKTGTLDIDDCEIHL